MLYIGADIPLPIIPWNEKVRTFHSRDLTVDESSVRAQFTVQHVYYAGTYELCGCAFNYGREYPKYENDPKELARVQEMLHLLSQYLSSALQSATIVQVYSTESDDLQKSKDSIRSATLDRLFDKDFLFLNRELLTLEKQQV